MNKPLIFVFLRVFLIGAMGLTIVVDRIEHHKLKQAFGLINKCFEYKDYAMPKGERYFNKVTKVVSSTGPTIEVVYTFQGKPYHKFYRHWACLQGMECYRTKVAYFLESMKESPCPW